MAPAIDAMVLPKNSGREELFDFLKSHAYMLLGSWICRHRYQAKKI